MLPRREGRPFRIGQRRARRGMEGRQIQAERCHSFDSRISQTWSALSSSRSGVEELEHHLGQLRDSLFAQPRHGDASVIALMRAALVRAAPTFF
jgi:hypothetical protein